MKQPGGTDYKKYFPLIGQLSDYGKRDLRSDLFAGLTVGVMLIPQGMAYAMIAGLPPIYGLYAPIIPLIIYAIMGSSRHLSLGPAAMVALLVGAGLSNIAEPGTEAYIHLAIALAFAAGILQFLFGFFRMGFLLHFISHPVLSGFTSAAAIIIVLSQVQYILGIDVPSAHIVQEIFHLILENIAQVHWLTVILSVSGILFLLVMKRYLSKWPAALILLFLGISASYLFELESIGVAVIGDIPRGLPSMSNPLSSVTDFGKMGTTIITIALIGILESVAIAKAVRNMHKTYKVRPNQEMLALGAANMIGSFFRAFPIAGSFSRTAVNSEAGARTGIASIVTSVLLIGTLLFLTPLFQYLPEAFLASIIVVAASSLVDYREVKFLFRSDRMDLSMLLVTFIATLFLGVEAGIILGVIMSFLWVLYSSSRPHVAVLGKIPDSPYYRNIDRFGNLIDRDDILIVRFDSSLYFANADYFADTIEELVNARKVKPKRLVIDAESINRIDSTAIHQLKEVESYCASIGIKLNMAGVKGPIRDILKRSGVFEHFDEDQFFISIQDAVESHDEDAKSEFKDFTLQHSDKRNLPRKPIKPLLKDPNKN